VLCLFVLLGRGRATPGAEAPPAFAGEA
jgi:hypothetical protein